MSDVRSGHSYEKCIPIFHLPPFSVYLSNYQRNEWVEDSVFKPFIFHLYLPSSTHCFWWIRYWSVIVYSVLSICLCRLKHFLFLSIFSENGPDFISSRMPVPMSPYTRAHRPGYTGWDKFSMMNDNILIYNALISWRNQLAFLLISVFKLLSPPSRVLL